MTYTPIRSEYWKLRQIAIAAQALRLSAENAVLSLPIVLGEAELALDRAEEEWADGLYSPFWEAIEEATGRLNTFQSTLTSLSRLSAQHQEAHNQFKARLPGVKFGPVNPSLTVQPFVLGHLVLPDPTPTGGRLRALYRQAQRNSEFAMIYEQRRIAAKLDATNALVAAGFSSLGDAVRQLGDEVIESVNVLRLELSAAAGDLLAALEAATQSSAEQHGELMGQLEHSGAEAAVVATLRQAAEERSRHELMARRMLDNIQRRRAPRVGESFDT